MTPHEIKPKQLRALLLLLVLVPLIPAALMIRFMTDALKAERLTALEQAQQLYTDVLSSALRSSTPGDGTTSDEDRASRVVSSIRNLNDSNVTARVVASDGRIVAGEPNPWGLPVVQDVIPGTAELTAQIHFSGPNVIGHSIAEQRDSFIVIGTVTTLGVLLIAGLAALAVNRQLSLSELKSTSVATVAHELRTPLASMRMLVDTLREGRYRDDTQLREYLDLIAAENERLTRLAENFLTFSRLQRSAQRPDMAAVRPGEVIEQALRPLNPRLDAADFSIDVPASLPAISADRDSLAQVLTNLIDNALKYTESEKRIALRVSRDGEHVAFSVEDNGIGISDDERREIFEPFHQADQRLSRTREGCGLGLAIARQIVEAHCGKIEVVSTPGKGSVFTVKIPIA